MKSIHPNIKNTKQSRIISVVIFLVTLLLASSVVFAVTELYLRYKFDVDTHAEEGMIRPDHNRGWALRPGQYNKIDLRAMRKSSISINRLGFRDKEVSLQPSDGKKRLTVIGDSFVFGQVLNYGQRFTEILEEILDSNWEVVNVSVPGYGTGQELLFLAELESKGFEVGDEVVLVFFTNDILDNVGLDYGTGARNSRQPVFEIDNKLLRISEYPEISTKPERSTRRGFLEDSLAVSFLRMVATDWAGRHPEYISSLIAAGIDVSLPRTPGIITGWYLTDWEKRWELTQKILLYAVTNVFDKRNFSIAFVPSPLQVEPSVLKVIDSMKNNKPGFAEFIRDPDRPQRKLREFCLKNNISFIDTTPMLREASRERPTYFLREGHLNPTGTRIVAEILRDAILNKQ